MSTHTKSAPSEQLFEQLFWQSNDGLLLIENFRIVACNPAMATVLEADINEIIGTHPADWSVNTQPDGTKSRTAGDQYLQITLDTGDHEPFYWLHKRSAEEEAEVEVRLSRISHEGRIFILAIVRDVTARRNAERLLAHSEQQLRQLHRRLDAVRDAERKAMASEVHDVLGQVLTALKIDISMLPQLIEEGSASLTNRVESMGELINESLQSVRRIAHDLRPPVLDELGLAATIDWLAERFTHHSDATCEIRIGLSNPDFGEDANLAICRIVQEALTNITRHSDASAVLVELNIEKDMAVVEIRDNGQGIDLTELDPYTLGIRGMKERAQGIGAALEVGANKDQGTLVRLTLPLSASTGDPA